MPQLRIEKLTLVFKKLIASTKEKIIEIENSEDHLTLNFGVTRNEIIEVVKQALLARSEVTANHPMNARGIYSYNEGIRYLRDLLIPKGWKTERPNNLELVTNSDETISITFQNATDACDPAAIPQPISKKGPASKKAIEERNYDLFANDNVLEKNNNRLNKLWYLCVAIREVHDVISVSAELFRPKKVENEYFDGFIERIFIMKNEDLSGVFLDENLPSDYEAEEDTIDLVITKKQS